MKCKEISFNSWPARGVIAASNLMLAWTAFSFSGQMYDARERFTIPQNIVLQTFTAGSGLVACAGAAFALKPARRRSL
jgi:hypothetical protein